MTSPPAPSASGDRRLAPGFPFQVALLVGLFLPAVAAASPRAERIEEETAAQLLIGGPDAIGGVGDWYLANDVVEVIVDDVGRAYGTLNHGGTIVDAGLRDRRGEDQFARLFPIVNVDQRVFIDFDSIRAEVDEAGGWARLVVWGSRGMSAAPRRSGLSRWLDPRVPELEELREVFVETEYAVFPGEPFVHVTTTIRNEGDSPAPLFAYGDVWMRGGRSGRSWVGNTLDPARSRGFHHRSFNRRNLLATRDAMAAFTFVSVTGVRQFPPIAYAICSPERTERGERSFGVTGEHVTLINAFTFDSGWEELGLLRLLRASQRGIPPGESWVYRRRLLVTGRSDAASTTDVIFPLLGFADGSSGIAGRVEPAELPVVIQVDTAAGSPITQIETPTRGEGAGRYRAALPPGDYRLTLRAPHRTFRHVEVSVPPGRYAEVAPQRFEEPGWLIFDPAFGDGGAGRVIVLGVEGTPDPVFDPELLDFRVDAQPGESATETRELYFIGGGRDPRRVAIPPGRYELVAVRGFEYDVDRVAVEVPGPGRAVRLPPFAPRRVVELGGVVRADLHVHAQASDDSAMTNESRLRSFIAEGVDLIVTTDHDHLGFFEPALDALGVRDRIRVVQGVEVTSSAPSPTAPWTIGHHNSWPIPYRPLLHRRGAPPSQNLTAAELYATLRRDYGVAVVQLNHPEPSDPDAIDEQNYFSHLATAGEEYDPTRPIDVSPNHLLLETASDGRTRAIDFDAIEVINGPSLSKYRAVRADWYSLLQQGFRRTGTANSDTHGPDQPAGYPRNYVTVGPGPSWDQRTFDDAIRAGRVFGSNGPLIAEFRVNGGGMGDLVAAPGGRATVRFAIAAAPWVPVDEVRIAVNGGIERAYGRSELNSEDVVRLSGELEIELAGDAFVTLEAGVPLDAEQEAWIAERGGLYSETIAPGFVPMAFTNPVFLDVDGNGRFDPPGIPPAPRGPGRPLAALLAAALVALTVALARRRRKRFGEVR